MSMPGVPSGDMPTPPLDPNTADRLLAGAIQPDDAPVGYRHVAALVAVARRPASGSELAEPPEGLAELVVASPEPAVPVPRLRRRSTKVAVVSAVLCLSASSAAAATNNLPAPIQRAVSSVASQIGVTIPTPRPPDTAPEPAPPGPGPTLHVVPDTAELAPAERLPSLPEPDVVVPPGPLPTVPAPGSVGEVIPETVPPPTLDEVCPDVPVPGGTTDCPTEPPPVVAVPGSHAGGDAERGTDEGGGLVPGVVVNAAPWMGG